MAAEVMMTLGEIEFAMDKRAYDELVHEAEYRWAQLDRLGKRPAMQFIGVGMETLTFQGTVYPAMSPSGGEEVVGIRQVEDMRKVAEAGAPLELTDGMGRAWGKWCIVSITETSTVLMSNSAPRKQTFSMVCKKYGDDESGLDGIIFNGGGFSVPRNFGSGVAGVA